MYWEALENGFGYGNDAQYSSMVKQVEKGPQVCDDGARIQNETDISVTVFQGSARTSAPLNAELYAVRCMYKEGITSGYRYGRK